MSTRSNIHFLGYNGKPEANVYRHSDGYPSAMVPDLYRFFDDVKEQTKDTRFNDATYLAAKFVVWQANECMRGGGGFLNFSGVGVVLEDAGDGMYIWEVNCLEHDADGLPIVTGRSVNGEVVAVAENRESAEVVNARKVLKKAAMK
jgi:hypothetical protein